MGPETKIEKAVCDYAESKGFEHRKLVWKGRKDAPDRIFWRVSPPVHPFFIEFKAPGEDGRRGQIKELISLHGAGANTYLCDDVFVGERIIDREAKEIL